MHKCVVDTNKHEWMTGEHFQKCDHAPYTAEESERRPWLTAGSKASTLIAGYSSKVLITGGARSNTFQAHAGADDGAPPLLFAHAVSSVMSVTLLVSQAPSGWLKAYAARNIF